MMLRSRLPYLPRTGRRQAGATLIEGLVALAVFSFGMLAIVGMLAS